MTLVGEEFGKPIVSFPLPDGAGSIEFDDGLLGERYLKTEDGFGDTLSIPPGEGVYQVVVYYTLPYPRYKLDFIQRMNYPTEALVVMTPPEGVKIKGSTLEDLGTQSIPNGAVQVYLGDAVSGGEQIQFRISGAPETIRGAGPPPTIQFPNYLIGIALFGVLLFAAGVFLFIKNRRIGSLEGEGEDPSEIKNRILDSIIALEDLYNTGEIPEDVFQKKRQEYKDQLKEIDQ
jgi:hypothetical protein